MNQVLAQMGLESGGVGCVSTSQRWSLEPSEWLSKPSKGSVGRGRVVRLAVQR